MSTRIYKLFRYQNLSYLRISHLFFAHPSGFFFLQFGNHQPPDALNPFTFHFVRFLSFCFPPILCDRRRIPGLEGTKIIGNHFIVSPLVFLFLMNLPLCCCCFLFSWVGSLSLSLRPSCPFAAAKRPLFFFFASFVRPRLFPLSSSLFHHTFLRLSSCNATFFFPLYFFSLVPYPQ